MIASIAAIIFPRCLRGKIIAAILAIMDLRKYPDAQREWIEFLRGLSTAERWQRVAALNCTVRAMLTDILRRRHPDADETEMRHRLCAVMYGTEIAAKALGQLPPGMVEDAIPIPVIHALGPSCLVKGRR